MVHSIAPFHAPTYISSTLMSRVVDSVIFKNKRLCETLATKKVNFPTEFVHFEHGYSRLALALHLSKTIYWNFNLIRIESNTHICRSFFRDTEVQELIRDWLHPLMVICTIYVFSFVLQVALCEKFRTLNPLKNIKAKIVHFSSSFRSFPSVEKKYPSPQFCRHRKVFVF